MPTATINGAEYGIYRSEFIKGQRSVLRQTAEFCLKDETILEFWRSVVRAIRDDRMRNDKDGEVFSSEETDVFLGPWSIDIRHHIEYAFERRYDVGLGIYENISYVSYESFEAVEAYDVDNDESLPGIVYLLNAFYKTHKREIFKTI